MDIDESSISWMTIPYIFHRFLSIFKARVPQQQNKQTSSAGDETSPELTICVIPFETNQQMK